MALAAGVLGEEEMQGLVWTGVQFTRDFPIDYSLLLVRSPASCAGAQIASRPGLQGLPASFLLGILHQVACPCHVSSMAMLMPRVPLLMQVWRALALEEWSVALFLLETRFSCCPAHLDLTPGMHLEIHAVLDCYTISVSMVYITSSVKIEREFDCFGF